MGSQPRLSIVIPALNESASLEILLGRTSKVVEQQLKFTYEIIVVDDGSTDESWPLLHSTTTTNPYVRAFRLRRNFGKAVALSVGFAKARGELIATMDADLQDDPEELPNFVAKLAEGYDLIVGWKKERHDPLAKTLPSKLFNAVTSVVCGLAIRDFNCGFKMGRREVFANISIYGELHRYIPVLAYDAGFRISQIPVRHHARRFGRSKYGFKRFLRGFLDLLTVVTITRYNWRPAHLFGGIGILAAVGGSAILLYLAVLKLLTDATIGDRPLLTLGMLMFITGLQFVFFGMLAEMMLSQRKIETYDHLIGERLEGDAAPGFL